MTPDPKPGELLSSDSPELLPRRRYRPWVARLLLFVACIVSVDALVGEQGLAETLRARRDLQRASAELTLLRQQNERLGQEALRLRHDLRSIEDLARRDLGLVKAGEILVILNDVPK